MSMDQQLNRRRIYFSDAEGVGPEEGRGVRAVWAAVAFRHSVSDTKDPTMRVSVLVLVLCPRLNQHFD